MVIFTKHFYLQLVIIFSKIFGRRPPNIPNIAINIKEYIIGYFLENDSIFNKCKINIKKTIKPIDKINAIINEFIWLTKNSNTPKRSVTIDIINNILIIYYLHS